MADLNKVWKNRKNSQDEGMDSAQDQVREDSDADVYVGNDVFPPDPMQYLPSLSASRREKK